jgi:hypothetical protein
MMNSDGRELCFIVGHYKSGSTWLANLLSLHPEVRGVSESHVFRLSSDCADFRECARRLFEQGAWAEGGWKRLPRHRIAKWTRPSRVLLGLAKGQSTLAAYERPTTRLDLGVVDQIRMRRHLERAVTAEEFCRRFFEFIHGRLRPGRYLMEKTPTNVYFIPMIKEMYPAAKLVSIYRDGRDVVVSDKFYSANELDRVVQLKDSTLKWRSAMQAQLQHSETYRIHCLSYESLLRDPVKMVHELLDYLELPSTPSLVDDMIRRSSFEFITGRPSGSSAKAFYRKGVAADWVNHFSEADMDQFGELAGDLLVTLGYEPTADAVGWQLNQSKSNQAIAKTQTA